MVTLEELGSRVFGQRGCRKPSKGRRCLFALLFFFFEIFHLTVLVGIGTIIQDLCVSLPTRGR